MRTFLGGNNTDTTAAAVAYLKTNRQARYAHLVIIGENEDADHLWLTDYNSPLTWSVWGQFKPASIDVGDIPSQVGFDVPTLDLVWRPPLGSFTQNLATTSPYQKAYLGFYDNRMVRVWKTVMPTPGDADTYGATLMFGGWISQTEITRGQIKFTVESWMNVLNQQLPANLLEGTSALAGFMAGSPVIADGETNVPTFTVKAPSSQTVILGDTIQPSAHKIYSNKKLANGYITFLTGSLAGATSIVATNSNFNFGGGTHYNQFQVYNAFPWAPTPGDTFYVASKPPINQADPTSTLYGYTGFPYLPDPEQNL